MTDQSKPNVVFILTDDQGPWAAGCCGNDEVRTPNIDRLASAGMRVENFLKTEERPWQKRAAAPAQPGCHTKVLSVAPRRYAASPTRKSHCAGPRRL